MRRPGNSKNGLSTRELEDADQSSGDSGTNPDWLPDASAANAVLERRSRARRSQESAELLTDPLQFLRTRDVCRLLGISKPTLWRLRRANAFPEPTELTNRVIGWRRSELEEWLSTRNRGTRASNRPPAPTKWATVAGEKQSHSREDGSSPQKEQLSLSLKVRT
jgi:predicted DNA-binding transcriptional regulator AlpA